MNSNLQLQNLNPAKGISLQTSGRHQLKLYMVFAVLYFIFSFNIHAQVASGYNFTGSSGTYSAISGGATLGTATNDDDVFSNYTIGFTFFYNGANYTAFSVNANGFLALGTTVSSSYNAISTGSTNQVISALNRDLTGRTGIAELRYQTIGSAPNRTLVLQWTNYKRYSSTTTYDGDTLNFQVRLNEADSSIQFVYGFCTLNTTSSNTFEVGLRGGSSADFNNRTATTSWSTTTAGSVASASMTMTNAIVPASGQTYTWKPIPMSYGSSTATQTVTSPVPPGATNQQIIGVQVVANGLVGSLNLTALALSTAGSTNASNITAARVFYTGTSSTFTTTTQFGSTVSTPFGGFSVTGSQALVAGTNYFWVAYDVSAGASIGNVLDAQCTQVTVNGSNYTPSITNPAGNRSILTPLSGTYTVGVSGFFPTLTAASNAVSGVGIAGPVILSLIDQNYSVNETFPITFGIVTGASAANTITIKPAAGTDVVITGNSTSSIFKLNGTDYFIIDGSNNTAASKNLTIMNTSTVAGTAVLWYASQGNGAGCLNDSLANCIIKAGSLTSTNYGVYVAGTALTTTGTGNDNDNFKLYNNEISSCYYGVYVRASAAANASDNILISGNIIGSLVSTSAIGFRFIDLAYVNTGIVSQNKMGGISITSSFDGVLVGTGVTALTMSRNSLFNMVNSGTNRAAAITISAGTTSGNKFDNNEIYNVINNGTAGNSFGAYGFYLTAGSGYSFYHNTVNMFGDRDAVATTKPTSISAAFMVNFAAASGAIDLRNNVFVNSQTAATNSTKSYAIYSAAAATGYSNINYNDYYVSGAQGVLGYLGADQATISAWKTATSADANSISLSPSFNSNTVVRPIAISMLMISLAPQISGITTDLLGVSRGATTTMGAYEQAGEFIPPVLTYTNLSNIVSTSNRTTSSFATITDASGINNTTGTKPRIYYKKSTNANAYVGNTSADNGWKYVEANNTSSPYDFTIDYSKLTGGSVSPGEVIQYFVIAQDNASIPNVTWTSGVNLVSNPSSVNLNSGHFPVWGAINSYSIALQLSGTYLVGSGQQFTSLTNTGGFFEYVNNNAIAGDVVALVTSNLTETGAVALSQTTEVGGVGFTISIQPSAPVMRTISGAFVGALIRLNGADRIIFDGRFNGTGTGKYLTVMNTAGSGNTAIFQLISQGNGAGAVRNTFRNLIIKAAYTAASSGIFVAGAALTTASTGSDNDSLTIINNSIKSGSNAIFVAGNTGYESDNILIQDNIIGEDTMSYTGVYLGSCKYVQFKGNRISNVYYPTSTSTDNATGLKIGLGSSEMTIENNIIEKVAYTGSGGYGGKGIDVNTGLSASNIIIRNNFVTGVFGDGDQNIELYGITGIGIRGTTGNVYVYNNTVKLGGVISVGTYTSRSVAFYTGASTSNIVVRNNIFFNNIYKSNVAAAQSFAIFNNATSNSNYGSIAYNNYYAAGPQATLGFSSAANKATLSDWKTDVTADVNSQSVNVYFVDTTTANLRLTGSSNGDYYLRAQRIAANDVDIDNTSRTSITYMGAHQASTSLNMTVNAGNDTTVCAGTGVQLGGSNIVTGGIATYTYSWSPSLSAVSNPTATPTTTTQYVVTVTDNLGFTAMDSVLITVNPAPAVPTVNVPSTTCSGFSANLTASGTGTLNWYDVPSGGSALTSGSNYTTPVLTATDTFWVDATQSGCTSSRTRAIVPITSPANPTPSAPSPICAGNTVNLTASVGSGILTWYKNASGGTALGTGSPYTTSVLNANDSFYVSANLNGCMSSRVKVNVTVNSIPSAPTVNTPAAICAGTNTIITTTGTGTKKWYTASSGGTAIYTGDTLTTSILTANTTYYADNTVNGCVSTGRTPVTVSINPIPALPSVAAVSICEGSAATLNATGFSTGDSIHWYDAATAGNMVGTGATYISGALTAGTSTFYAGIKSAAGCSNAGRTPGVVTVSVIPSAPAVNGTTICEATSATLDFSALPGSLKWYDDSTGTVPSYTGSIYTSATMSANDTFYVSTTVSGCESSRNQLVIAVTPLPAKPVAANTAICEGHPATLSATGSSPIAWYLTATGGTSFDTGNAIIVNGITNTTVYFAESHNGVCASATRTPVVVVFNSKPDAAFTVLGQLAGQVTFKANALSGVNYNWNFGNSTTSTAASPTCVYATNGSYNVKLVVLNPTTGCSDSTTTNVTVGTVGTGNKLVNGMMASAYPNPFENKTTIDYTISQAANVSVKIVDLMGREVMDIPAEQQQAGNYQINWNSEHLSAGVYYVRLNINGQNHTLRLVKAQK